MGTRGELYTSRASSRNRTYFFNVKENRSGDLFLNIVESKKHGETGFERHQIMVFEEELDNFSSEFEKAIDFMRSRKRQPGGAGRNAFRNIGRLAESGSNTDDRSDTLC